MQRSDPEGPAVEDIVLSVPAMTCRHCVRAISAQVRDVAGVVAVEADLTSGTLCVQGTAEPDALRSAIADAGYEAVEVSRTVVEKETTEVVTELSRAPWRLRRRRGPGFTGGHLS